MFLLEGEVRLFFGWKDAFFKHLHFLPTETKIDILEKFGTEFKTLKIEIFENFFTM